MTEKLNKHGLRDQRRSGATVSAAYAGNLLHNAAVRGINRAALIAQSGIDAAAFDDPDNRIPL